MEKPDLKTKIAMLVNHFESIGAIEKTRDGLRIHSDYLKFGTATSEEDKTKGIIFVMYSEITKIETVHVISDRNTLFELRVAIDKVLEETAPEVA